MLVTRARSTGATGFRGSTPGANPSACPAPLLSEMGQASPASTPLPLSSQALNFLDSKLRNASGLLVRRAAITSPLGTRQYEFLETWITDPRSTIRNPEGWFIHLYLASRFNRTIEE